MSRNLILNSLLSLTVLLFVQACTLDVGEIKEWGDIDLDANEMADMDTDRDVELQPADGDFEPLGEGEDRDLHEEDVEGFAEEDEDEDGDIEVLPDGSCRRTIDCRRPLVCGAEGKCIEPCGIDSCPFGRCNPYNGYCEYCDPFCGHDSCCRYYSQGDFAQWKCSFCCEPPCLEGQTCDNDGNCIDIVCPECAEGFECCEASDYLCISIQAGRSICPEEPIDGDATHCESSSDCPDGEICISGGNCVAACDEQSCEDGSHCNPNNGRCEYCETDCPYGRCCNFNQGEFWYCGSCCEPPCYPERACQGGTCVELKCKPCERTEECCARTGYMCMDLNPEAPLCSNEGICWDEESPPDPLPECCRKSDCPSGTYCTDGGICKADCMTTGCRNGHCNEDTGSCEFCEDQCNENLCCNWAEPYYEGDEGFWYCGNCCEPPCEEGLVCSGGSCIEANCPDSCPWGYHCSLDTGWVCERIEHCQCHTIDECCDGCHGVNDGRSCDDLIESTIDDRCTGGFCTGVAEQCLDDVPDWTQCNDSNDGTSRDYCISGRCVGQKAESCLDKSCRGMNDCCNSAYCALDEGNSVGVCREMKVFGIPLVDVIDLEFSDDNNLLAAATDSRIVLWNLEKSRVIRSIEYYEADLKKISIGETGLLVASLDSDGKISLWDMSDASVSRTIEPESGDPVSIFLLPELLIVAMEEGTVEIWSIEGGTSNVRVTVEQGIDTCALSPDWKTFIASKDSNLYAYDLYSGEQIWVEDNTESRVNDIAFSSDSERLAVGRDDGSVRIRTGREGERVGDVLENERSIVGVSFFDQNESLIIATISGGRKIIRLQDLYVFDPFGESENVEISALALSSDDRFFAFGGENGFLELWSGENFLRMYEMSDIVVDGRSVCASPDGDLIAFGVGKFAHVHDWQRNRLAYVLSSGGANVGDLAFSRDGMNLSAGTFAFGENSLRNNLHGILRTWRMSDGMAIRDIEGSAVSGYSYNALVFHPFYNKLFMNYYSTYGNSFYNPWGYGYTSYVERRHAVQYFDMETETSLPISINHYPVMSTLQISPNGSVIATAGCKSFSQLNGICSEGFIHLYLFPFDGEALLNEYSEQTIGAWVNALAFSPDRDLLAAGGGDTGNRMRDYSGELVLFDVTTGEAVETLQSNTRVIHSVAFSPDGKMLAAGDGDGRIHLWSMTDRTRIKTLVGHDAEPLSLQFMPQGDWLLSGGADGTARLWDISDAYESQLWECEEDHHCPQSDKCNAFIHRCTTLYSDCNDGEDNDGDGRTDEDDPDCAVTNIEMGNCSDGIDSDADGWTDEEDPDCAGNRERGYLGESYPDRYTCNDGIDQDGDNLIDSEDPDCIDALSEENPDSEN